MKITNEYALLYPKYHETPKAVVAAVAYSLAMRLGSDSTEAAEEMLLAEWRSLYDSGIVEQRPLPSR